MVMISKYLDEKFIKFFSAKERDEVIEILVEELNSAGVLLDKQAFYQAILDREKVVSTGIGMGVAIPHAKLSSYDDFFISIGILKEGVNWNALDGSPVRIVFLIGGPDDKQTQYLQILSNLTLAIKDEERRRRMLDLTEVKDIIRLFEEL